MNQISNVHLDTDIGDDIDDAFCLALMLASPEIALRSISTVFLYTDRRCDLAREMCRAAGKNVEIVPGMRGVMAAHGVHRWAERRLTHVPRERGEHPLPEVALLPAMRNARNNCDAIFTIGPMTNLAATLMADPDLSGFPQVYAMAAEFERPEHKEWNIVVDPEAAAKCFSSGITMNVIPWSIGPAAKLQPEDIARLRTARSALVKLLVAWLEEFWTHVPNKTNMYDPMTVVAMLRPDLFQWRRGRVIVELRDPARYSLTRFEPDESGPHRVAFAVQASEARQFLVQRLLDF